MRKETNRESLKTDFESTESYAKGKNEYTRIKVFGDKEITDYIYDRQDKHFEKIVWSYLQNRKDWIGYIFETRQTFKDITTTIESIKNPKIVIDTVDDLNKIKNNIIHVNKLNILNELVPEVLKVFDALKKWWYKRSLNKKDKEYLTDLVLKEDWDKLFAEYEAGDRFISDEASVDSMTTASLSHLLDKFKIDYLPKLSGIYSCQYSDFRTRNDIIEFIIPNNIKYIGRCAFSCCVKLKQIVIPESVNTIDPWAFAHCESLTSITLPKNLKYLGWQFGGREGNVFYNCPNLTEIYYNGTMEDWSEIKKLEYSDDDEDAWDAGSAIKVIHCIDGDIEIE